MKDFMLEDETFEITIKSLDGKIDYSFNVEYEWISSSEIIFDFSDLYIQGNQHENLTIWFDQT